MSKPKRSSLGSCNGLPSPVTATHAEKQRHHWHKNSRTAQHASPYRPGPAPRIPRPRMTTILLVALTFYALCGYVTLGRSSSPQDIIIEAEPTERDLAPGTSVFGSDSVRWAQYSPYFPVEPYAAPPEGCEVDQVSLLRSDCTPCLVADTLRGHAQVHIVRFVRLLYYHGTAHCACEDSTSWCTLPNQRSSNAHTSCPRQTAAVVLPQQLFLRLHTQLHLHPWPRFLSVSRSSRVSISSSSC